MTTNIHWFPGHMAKAIKQIDEQIKLIDLIIEIVDSRIPLSSANPLIDKLRGKKPKIVILNKIDLADPYITEKWIKYYKKNKIEVLPLDSKHSKITKLIITKINDILKEKIERDLTKGIKNSKLKVLVMGIPNVGKSTFINALINKNSTRVGNKPGVTKGQQWIKLTNHIDLIDTPGILWPKIDSQQVALNLTFVRAIKEDILPKEDICLAAIKWIYQNYFTILAASYQLEYDKNIDLSNEVDVFNILLKMQENRFHKIDEDYTDNIVMDFLNKLWNNNFGRISFESPGKGD